MRILAVGLDTLTIDFLRSNGVAVEPQEVENAGELKEWMVDGIYDAGVVDLDKSNLGIYCCRGLRMMKLSTVIIGISQGGDGQSWGDHRAMFLENGGDDLLRGPANPRELTASLRAATRRFKGALLDIIECQYGGARLKINLTTKSVLVNDQPVAFTNKEAALMLLLASSAGRVLSKEMILGQIYTDGVEDEPEMKIIDVFICKARKKLADLHEDAGKLVETIWGRGYRLSIPVADYPTTLPTDASKVHISQSEELAEVDRIARRA